MFTRPAALLVLLLLGTSTAYAHEDIQQQCMDLVLGYAYHRDNFNADQFSQLFTENASLTVLGQTWQGRDEIRGRIEALDNGSSIRHLMSTMRITPIDDDHATGISYVTIYSAASGVSIVQQPSLIGEYHDDFVRTAAGWRIENRVLHAVYTFQ